MSGLFLLSNRHRDDSLTSFVLDVNGLSVGPTARELVGIKSEVDCCRGLLLFSMCGNGLGLLCASLCGLDCIDFLEVVREVGEWLSQMD